MIIRNWKDCTTYTRCNTDREPTTFEYVNSSFRVVITKGHAHFPGVWVMNCPALSIQAHKLNCDHPEVAMQLAVAVVKNRLHTMIEALKEEGKE